MKTGIIYKATSPSGRIYIGKTTNKLSTRKNNHYSVAYNKNSLNYNAAFSRAIRKYDKDNFKWEILYQNIPEKYLSSMEIIIIKWYDTYNKGYNSTVGGEGSTGFKHSEESKQKMSKAKKGKITLSKSAKIKLHMSCINYWTKEKKEKLSKSYSGQGNPRYGAVLTEKTKEKISNTRKGQHSGENNPRSKLTWKKVKKIRSKYIPYKYTISKLAKEYNIGITAIGDIIRNKTWKE